MKCDQAAFDDFLQFPSKRTHDEAELIRKRIAVLEHRLAVLGKFVPSVVQIYPKRAASGARLCGRRSSVGRAQTRAGFGTRRFFFRT